MAATKSGKKEKPALERTMTKGEVVETPTLEAKMDAPVVSNCIQLSAPADEEEQFKINESRRETVDVPVVVDDQAETFKVEETATIDTAATEEEKKEEPSKKKKNKKGKK